ncbi:MAG TPA: glycosyltransferase family 39 protein [Chthonomonadaceae bacterium]|nr:glycosyltransferase family 39 protein [Chthonomonadaceae bacterium]
MTQTDVPISNASPSTAPGPAPASPSSPATPQGQGAAAWALLLLCLFAFFFRLGSITLFDLDEALYVTCARQMALSGDIITPRLNTRPIRDPTATTAPFYEKPILVYWLPATSMRLFGFSEWAARLPVALAALLMTWLVAQMGTVWFGRRAGLLAGFVYATAPMTIVDARQMTTDGLLVLWFTLALVGFWNSYKRRGTRWALLFWAMCALAVLTKGAIGLLLPAIVAGVFLALDRFVLRLRLGGWRSLLFVFRLRLRPVSAWVPDVRALRPVLGLLLFLAIAAPWHLVIWRTGGLDANGHTWYWEYILDQHIGRFKGVDKVHNAPIVTYFAYFLLGFFPWACFTPRAFRLRADRADPAREVRRFLLIWFWTIFVFFSLGAAKLPNYIVPAFPAAALLIGRWLDRALSARADRADDRALRRGAFWAAVTGAILAAGMALAPHFAPKASPIAPSIVRFGLETFLLLLGGCALAWLCFLPRKKSLSWRKAGVGALILTLPVVVLFVTLEGYPIIEREILAPYQQIAVDARPDVQAGLPVIYYHIIPRRPSMNFYARYSPLETKALHEPLLPYLRPYLTPTHPDVDVVTSRYDFDHLVKPELSTVPGLSTRILSERGNVNGGWVLLRVTLHTS